MKKILSIVLSAMMLFPIVACKGDDQNSQEQQSSQETTLPKGVVLVNDFENNDEFNLLRLFGVLGKVTKNTDENFVRSGSASAKVVVDSNPYKEAAPYIEQAFELKKRDLDLRNFSNALAVSMDVYNATGADSRIGFQLAYKSGNGTRKNITLRPGWNTVSMNIKREYIPQYTDSNDVTAPFVESLKIMFDRPQEDATFYLDNLRLYQTEKGFSPIVMSLKEDEICSFDSEWQVELLEPEGRSGLLPSYSCVSDVTATGSGSSARIEAPGSSSNLGSWPGVFLNKDMTALVPWANYKEGAYLCFDVYAPVENGLTSIWMSLYAGGQRYFVTDELSVVPGRWVTYRFSVQEINSHWSNPNPSRYNLAATTGLTMRWAEHTGETKIVYLDNFRMEYSD